MDRNHLWRKILKSIIFLGVIMILICLIQNFDIYNVDKIMGSLHQMADKNAVKIPFILISVVMVVFFVPISAVAAAAGLLFKLNGILYVSLAGFLAALVTYAFAKLYRTNVEKWIFKLYRRKERDVPLEEMLERIREHGFSYALFIRALPFMPYSLGNLIFGMSTISFLDYISTTIITVVVGQGINVFLVSMASEFSVQKAGTLVAILLKGLYFFMIYTWSKKYSYHSNEGKDPEGEGLS